MKPLDFVGFCVLQFFFSFAFALFSLAHAQSEGLPLTFNVKEHHAAPDISNISRIRFLATADFPPFSFADAEGKLAGFNIDLVRAICRQLKVEEKCQLQVLPFGELQDALGARAGEAVIAGIAVTGKLRERFDFSRSYMALPARFLANAKETAGMTEPLDLGEKPVGIVSGSAEAEMLKAYFPTISAKPFKDRSDMLEALKKGEVAAVFAAGLQLSFWRISDDAAGCCSLLGGAYYSRYFLGEGMTIMTRKGEPLAKAFDAALAALVADGTLDELYLRYFPGGL